jgi:anaerobic magnesium-protoporphyrin IX monomethyl ester cyclase
MTPIETHMPWPFAGLFEACGDKVEVRDDSKYNSATSIMKPENMKREQVLKGLLKTRRR